MAAKTLKKPEHLVPKTDATEFLKEMAEDFDRCHDSSGNIIWSVRAIMCRRIIKLLEEH